MALLPGPHLIPGPHLLPGGPLPLPDEATVATDARERLMLDATVVGFGMALGSSLAAIGQQPQGAWALVGGVIAYVWSRQRWPE